MCSQASKFRSPRGASPQFNKLLSSEFGSALSDQYSPMKLKKVYTWETNLVMSLFTETFKDVYIIFCFQYFFSMKKAKR